jgi:hypothetical protein
MHTEYISNNIYYYFSSCNLFNTTNINSDYIASNDGEKYIGKDLEGYGPGLIESIILAFAWKDWA